MSIKITDECLSCDACIDECPTSALVSSYEFSNSDVKHTIVRTKECNECSDVDILRCEEVCPAYGAIILNAG